jgi:Polysulphide reductase, NrfD
VAAVSTASKPIIKEPVWTPEIPTYFYVGGLAGASAAFALASSLNGEEAVARRAWLVAFGGSVVSPALLISDLGRPARFLNMLRMFKVTSPMSVGSWLLGLPLVAYTAALVANTAVPVWHHARVELPFLFVSGGAASAGAAAAMLAPVGEAGAARRLAVLGAAGELTVKRVMEHRLDAAQVGAPYHEGPAGRLGTAAEALTLAGAGVLALRGGRSRRWAVAGGALLTAGAVAERWSVFRAGFQSVARPQDTVVPQQRTRALRRAAFG